jgi:Divergent InlB B-repeat domain
VFSNWGGHEDCVDGNLFTNGGRLCIAFFHRIYDLTITLQGSGQVLGYGYDQQPLIDCGSKCQTSFSDEMQVSLQAIPSPGMTFGGWSGECGNSSQNPLMLEVTKEMTCQATFVVPAPVVTTPPVSPTTPVIPTTPVVTQPHSEELDSSTTATTSSTTTDNVSPVTPTPPATLTSPEVPTTPPVVTTPATVVTTPPVDTTPTTVVTTPVESIPPVDLIPPTPPPVVAVTPPPMIVPVLVETYYPSMMFVTHFNCPPTGNVDDICNYGGREVTNLNVQETGIVSNGVVSTTVVNTGWVSNFHITATGQLSGGVVTGYIKNDGVMRDFEFRGASLIGGTLGGVITNTSQIGGYFQDVTLLANTQITGGILKGTIKGDKKSPALLENVRVKGGSKLSGVKLGKNVKLEKGVVVEK